MILRRPAPARRRRRLGVALAMGTAALAAGVAAPVAAAAAPPPFAFGTGECPPVDGVDVPVRQFRDAPQLCIDPNASYTAQFVTSEGTIVVALDTAVAPGTANNFVVLARYGYYDGTPIFRSEPMSDLFQGGGIDPASGPGYVIPDEGTGFTYPPGTLAMARGSEPNTAGAQWFFTTGDQARYLDQYGSFVAFGRVIEGLDVAERITELGDVNGRPTVEVILESVTILESP